MGLIFNHWSNRQLHESHSTVLNGSDGTDVAIFVTYSSQVYNHKDYHNTKASQKYNIELQAIMSKCKMIPCKIIIRGGNNIIILIGYTTTSYYSGCVESIYIYMPSDHKEYNYRFSWGVGYC